MFRELLPPNAQSLSYSNRVEARLNQALAFRSFEVARYTEHAKGKRKFYTADDEMSQIVIQRLNFIIKRFYKVRQTDRNLICAQIAQILNDSVRWNIVKIDLKSFYSSIDVDRILGRIHSDRLFCPYTFQLLEQAIHPGKNAHSMGLPEGNPLSATLSELHLRETDRRLTKSIGCVYYARFVDDIVIFTIEKPESAYASAQSFIDGVGEVNLDKKYIYDRQGSLPVDFEYLGYHFKKPRGPQPVKIEISQKKIKKIKTRIALSILEFGRDHNLIDLEDRIKYITGNAVLRLKTRSEEIKTGIYYTYPLLTEREAKNQMRKLDRYLYGMLFAKRGRIAQCLCSLGRSIKNSIARHSFSAGFKHRKIRSYSADEIAHIVKPWKYV